MQSSLVVDACREHFRQDLHGPITLQVYLKAGKTYITVQSDMHLPA